MNKTTAVSFITILIIIITFSSNIYALESENNSKTTILLINRLSIDDIKEMKYVKEIINKEAIGLMNTRANKYNNDYSASITIGSGTKTDAVHSTSNSDNSSEENIHIFRRRTGFNYEDEDIINLDISKIHNLNLENNYNPYIGALGTTIHEMRMKTAVIGNSDISNYNVRFGPLLIMDEFGLVDLGDISKNTIEFDSSYPFGLKTNYDYIYEKYIDLKNSSNLILLELGDLYRLEMDKDNLSEAKFLDHRSKILNDIDGFIHRIYMNKGLEDARIIILNPFPSLISQENGERLTPVIIAGKAEASGILTSDTTRRKGIIGGIDISSHIISTLNGEVTKAKGNPIKILPQTDNLSYIEAINKKTGFIYINRLYILSTFAIYEIIISIIAFLGIQILSKYKFKTRIMEFLLLTNMSIPLVILLLPIFNNYNLINQFLLIIVLTTILTVISVIIRKNTLDSVILLSGFITLALTIDVFMDSRLIKYSYLGYDPIIGARYYGIGNEYMGILVGASIVFLTSLVDRFKMRNAFIIPPMLLIIITIGFPRLGANVGGTITAVFAFMFVILKMNIKNLKIKHYLYIFFTVTLFLTLLGIFDLFVLDSKSHLAKALSQIGNRGTVEIFSIIERKLAMNIKLLGVTIWSKVLLSSLMVFGILFYRPFGTLKIIFNKYTNLSIGLLGILVASIVGFMVNDSGVVAAATSTIYLIMTLMYLIYRELAELL